MGILGLTTFISNNSRNLFEGFSLHDCLLVIDGNSLAAQLFQNVSKCNSAFGGDYNEYAKTVRKFFHNLSKCRITPYVIFDGGYEDKKMKTVLKRLRCRIADASRLNPTNYSTYLLFPILLKDVFVEVLRSLNIKFIFCEYEADQEIAATARYLQCPVLSYDSDFFIYNVSYIPFPSLQLKPCLVQKEQTTYYTLKCKLYKVEYFLKYYTGIQSDVVPLIATLLGNDYVNRSVFSKFYHNLKQTKSKRRNIGQCRITALIEWLRNESYNSAMEKILNRFKISQRNRLTRLIQESCSNYTRTYCTSLNDLGLVQDPIIDQPRNNEIIENKVSVLEEQETSDDEDASSTTKSSISNSHSEDFIKYLEDNKSQKISYNWVFDVLKKGRASPKFYDLIHKSFYIASPQIEDFSLSDSNLASLPILLYSFNIITGFNCQQLIYEGRKNLGCKRMIIDCTTNISHDIKDKWKNREEMPHHEMFYCFLEQTIEKHILDDIIKLPRNIQIIILTLTWMIKSNDTYCSSKKSHIYSIVMCFITMSIVKCKIGGDFTHFEFNSKFSTSLKEGITKTSSIQLISSFDELDESKIHYEDCMVAASQLLKYFEINGKLLSTPKMFKNEYLHFFAQYQCCLQQINYLNSFTSELFEPCIINTSYSGTFLYNFYVNLKRRADPAFYIYQLLQTAPTVLSYFLFIIKFLGYEYSYPTQTTTKKSKKKKKEEKKPEGSDTQEFAEEIEEEDDQECDVNNRFYVLNLENP